MTWEQDCWAGGAVSVVSAVSAIYLAKRYESSLQVVCFTPCWLMWKWNGFQWTRTLKRIWIRALKYLYIPALMSRQPVSHEGSIPLRLGTPSFAGCVLECCLLSRSAAGPHWQSWMSCSVASCLLCLEMAFASGSARLLWKTLQQTYHIISRYIYSDMQIQRLANRTNSFKSK